MITKKRLVQACLALFLILSSSSCAQEEKRIIGYFTSWSTGARDFHIHNISGEKITHINYAFANISEDGEIMLGDEYADVDRFYEGDSWHADSLRGSFNQLRIIRDANPHLKTLISIGGHSWSIYFSDVAATLVARERFAASCIDFITEYDFDGIDIDWEYPVAGGIDENRNRPEDRQNFTLLLRELRSQLDDAEWDNDREYLLSAAISANPNYMRNIQLAQLHHYVNWINLMAYDFHGPWQGDGDRLTNFNAPLFPAHNDPNDEPFRSSFNVDAAVRNCLNHSVPAEKINICLPFYGRGYSGVENQNNGLFVEHEGPTDFGTWENGSFDYTDLKENYIDLNGYRSFWHPSAQVPWLYNENLQIMISYDDSSAISRKCNYLNTNNLGGVALWEFSGDRDEELLDVIFDRLYPDGHSIKQNEARFSPFKLSLDPAFPNPFNMTTRISYNLPFTTDVELSVRNVGGRLINYLIKGQFKNGRHTVVWNAQNNESGIYFIHLKASGKHEMRKVVLVK